MTYLSEEAAGNDPIELYTFTFEAQEWLFTDGDGDYIHPVTGKTYKAEPLSRGNLTQSDEDSSMSIEVTIDALNPIADFFRSPYLPARQVWLVIERLHRGSAAAPGVLFLGSVGSVTFEHAVAKLSCIPMRQAIGRIIPIQLVQALCSNTLYDGRCKANPAPFSVVRTITGIAGLTFSINAASGKAAAYYNGGFIEKVGIPPATIKEEIGVTLKMMYNPGYNIGDIVTLYAGCDKRLDTCIKKFDNNPHFQGFPFMPVLDPFADQIA